MIALHRVVLVLVVLIAIFCGGDSTTQCENPLFGFGGNNGGQLGDGTQMDRYTPVPVDQNGLLNGTKVTATAAGLSHSLVLTETGAVFSFGFNSNGQLGDGTTSNRNIPVAVHSSGVLNGTTITAIAAGGSHSLVLSSTGQVFSFGLNDKGQLGDGTFVDRNVPVAVHLSGVLNGTTITAFACGAQHSLVLSTTGPVFSFGFNDNGQLGDGTTTNRPSPVAVNTSGTLSGLSIVSVACGGYHSLVLSNTGRVFSFGANNNGQLGDGTTSKKLYPVAVDTSGLLNGVQITAISAGSAHSLVLSSLGQVFSFGNNNYGQLGDGTRTNSNVSVAVNSSGVLDGTHIKSIAAGYWFSLVLSEIGDVFAFGSDDHGELGDGNPSISSSVPVAVINSGVLNGVQITKISAGFSHALVLGQTLVPINPGTVWNGDSIGQPNHFHSKLNSISVSWSQFTANSKSVHSYNVKTTKFGNPGNVVLNRNVGVPQQQRRNLGDIFFQFQTDVNLEHNGTYVTTVTFNSHACGNKSASCDPFIVDLTPPKVQWDQIPDVWLTQNNFVFACDISDPESGIQSIELLLIDATNNEPLLPTISLTPNSGNQFSLSWPQYGQYFADWQFGKPIKLKITASNNAGLNSTQISGTTFQIIEFLAEVLYSKNGDPVRVCHFAYARWKWIGLNETMMEISLIESTTEDVVMSITDAPIPINSTHYELFPIPESLTPGQYRIKLQSLAQFNPPLISIGFPFTIEPAEACVNITSPNATSIWKFDQEYKIVWEGNGDLSDTMQLALIGNQEYNHIIKDNLGFTSSGFYDWVPWSVPPNQKYQVRMISTTGVASTSGRFEIVAPSWIDYLTGILKDPLSGILLIGLFLILLCLVVFCCCIAFLLICCWICRRHRKSKSAEKPRVEQIADEIFDPDADLMSEDDVEIGTQKTGSNSVSQDGDARMNILSTSLLTSGERSLAERVNEQFQSSKTCPPPDISSPQKINEWLRASAFLLEFAVTKECGMEMTSVLWESLGTDARRREMMQQHSQVLVLLQTCVHKADPEDWSFIERVQRSLECFDSNAKSVQFELLEELGSGAFGSVHVARRADTGETVAVKVIKHMKRALDGNSLREVIDVKKIKREILIMSILAMDNNPHLIHFIGHQVEEMRVLMVMARAVGNVKDVLMENRLYRKQHGDAAPMLSVDTKLNIGIQVAHALVYLHSFQIAHRDLKSENILLMNKLSAENSMVAVRLIDFGISRATEDAHSTFIQGTVSWAAPEVLQAGERAASPSISSSSETGTRKKKTNVTTAVDVYSFAYLLWALLTEREPHSNFGSSVELVKSHVKSNANCPLVIPNFDQLPASDTAKFDSKLFEMYRDLMLTCWQSDPNKRPKMSQVVSELKAIQAQMAL